MNPLLFSPRRRGDAENEEEGSSGGQDTGKNGLGFVETPIESPRLRASAVNPVEPGETTLIESPRLRASAVKTDAWREWGICAGLFLVGLGLALRAAWCQDWDLV